MKHKLNHSYIWLGALRVLPYILIAVFASSSGVIFDLVEESAADGYIALAAIGTLVCLVVITGIVMLVRFISYQYIWYEYTNEEFSYYSGIFSKKRVHVPYQRIQSINQKATLFQRIAGVCTVSIETAGGSSNTAVTLPYIERSAAEALRKELFERKQIAQMRAAGSEIPEGATLASLAAPEGAPVANIPAPMGAPAANIPAPEGVDLPTGIPATAGNALDAPARFVNDFRGAFGGEAIDTGAITYEYGLSNKELVLSAVTGKSSYVMVLFSILMALSSALSIIGYMFGTSEDEVFETLSDLISLIPSSWIVSAIASVGCFTLMVMVGIWLITVIGTCISYGGFRARRRGARIETEYGIINHNFNGIDIERIQSIEVSQSFFQRLLKSCTLSLARVASAAQESSSDSKTNNQAKLIIHPFVKLDKVDGILAERLPEWGDLPVASKRLPRRALRRAITRRTILQGGGFWLAVITFAVMFFCGLPFELGDIARADLEDYLTFYLIADVIARVLYGIAALLIILDIIGSVLWQRGSGFGYDQRYVTITNSGFSTDRTITPRTKVQLATLQTNPLQRHKQLTTIIAHTAAGVGSSTLKLIDVEAEEANAWFAWCHPGGNKTVVSPPSSMQ